jgi:hypothetical protein
MRVLAQALLGLAALASDASLPVGALELTAIAVPCAGAAAIGVSRARRRMLRERALVVPPR